MKSALFKTLIITLILLGNFSCKSFDITKYKTNEKINDGLPNMEIYYDTKMISQVMKGQCKGDCKSLPQEIIGHELRNNVFTNIGSDYTCRISIVEDDYKMNVGGAVFWGLTLGTGTLLGIPGRSDKLDLTITCHILDEYLNPVKVYYASGSGLAYVACYYGYKTKDCVNVAYSNALTDAFSKIKKEMKDDCENKFFSALKK